MEIQQHVQQSRTERLEALRMRSHCPLRSNALQRPDVSVQGLHHQTFAQISARGGGEAQ